MRQLWIVTPQTAACEAMKPAFEGLPGVSFFAARFHELPPHDAFVTAGNCYGIMTAGIDAAVVARFGPDIMTRVQRHIVAHWLGEQPVGTAFILDTGDSWCPKLVYAPTMRIPSSIAGTDAVYRATWAALVALYAFEGTVCLPSMGCGFGGMTHADSARQMAAAWRHSLRAPSSLGSDWDLPLARERRINGR